MRTLSIDSSGGWASFYVMALLLAISGCQDPGAAGLDQGYAALEQSRFDEAMTAADKYLQGNPNGRSAAQAMYLRGRAIEQRPKRDDAEAASNLREAQACYLKALQLSPSKKLETYLYTNLGTACFFLGDSASAASYWKESYQRLDREDLRSWVLYRIGLCQQRMGRWTDADGTFARVQREYGDSEAAERARSHRGYRGFYVQVAAFANAASAEKLAKELRAKGFAAVQQEKPERKLRVVLCGPLMTYVEAQATRMRLVGQFKDAMIIP